MFRWTFHKDEAFNTELRRRKFCKIACTSLHIQDDGIVFTDDDTQQDMFNLDSDEEDDAEEDYDAKWRQQRFEREKFLQEQEASCN